MKQNYNESIEDNDKEVVLKVEEPKRQTVDIFNDKKQDEMKEQHPTMAKILDNGYFNLVVSLFTIYALFGDDFRVIVATKPDDNIFNGLLITCMLVFIVEIFLSVKVTKGYWNSFFFWLDVVSTVTLILDLTWVSDAIA